MIECLWEGIETELRFDPDGTPPLERADGTKLDAPGVFYLDEPRHTAP